MQPKTRPVPKPAAGHVLIQVAFAGVNRHDCGQRIRGFGPKGANVVTTVGNAAKRDFCLKIGAHAAINYREQDFVAEIDKITSSHGADVILDMAGAAYAKRNLQALAMDGRVMHLSSGDSKEYSVALGAIMSKRAVMSGSQLRVSELPVKIEIVHQLNEKVWAHLGSKVTPVIDSVFPLEKACDAHARMETSEHIGKILLEVSH